MKKRTADEVYFGCGDDIVPACRFIIRYRNIFIKLYIDYDEGSGTGLTFDQIQTLLDSFEQHSRATLGV